MKSLVLLVLLVGVAHADKFPATGPCDDVDACEKACKANKKGTCYWGGVLIVQTAKQDDEPRALAMFDKACGKGEADACWQSANLVWYKESRDKGDGSKARAAFQKACGKNHARACLRLADIAAAAEGDAKSQKLAATSRAKGVKLLERKCAAKMARACSWVAELYESGMDGIKLDHAKAQAFRDKRCAIDTGKKCPPPEPPPPPPGTPQTKQAPAPTKAAPAPNKAATP
jgi:hypothetical protein